MCVSIFKIGPPTAKHSCFVSISFFLLLPRRERENNDNNTKREKKRSQHSNDNTCFGGANIQNTRAHSGIHKYTLTRAYTGRTCTKIERSRVRFPNELSLTDVNHALYKEKVM